MKYQSDSITLNSFSNFSLTFFPIYEQLRGSPLCWFCTKHDNILLWVFVANSPFSLGAGDLKAYKYS